MALGLFWLVGFLVHILSVSAETLNYEWNITWVSANPDGLQERLVIGINGQWPLPVLNFTLGDRVIAKNGTTHMDGAPSITQCDIAPGSTFVYNFTVNQTGTYWYHSHARGQYPDGLRQALVIKGPDEPYSDQYDEERVITLSEWYHDPMPTLLKQFISVTNPTGAEPVPKSALMNDTQNLTVAVEPGKTYLFRLVNVAAFASQYFWIEGHTMKIVEVDGVWTEPAEASMIYITAAQRYSFLVTMKNDTSKNYAMVGSMDTDLFDALPPTLNYNVTGWLVYDDKAERPGPADISSFDPYDDFGLVPADGEKLLGDPDYTVTLDLSMDNLGDGANYAFFNGITYVMPKVPTLYTALSTGSAATNSTVYGYNTNAFILNKGDIIDLVLNNDDTGKHPFHLHGHNFQVVARSDEDVGHYDANNHPAFPSVPMRRDTIYVKPTGHFVIRFRADNPGVWIFHCHIEWHMDAGLAVVLIEAPLDLQQTLTIPDDHWQACDASNTLKEGNAAGNTKDFYDLTGANTSVPPLPAGFTARGIVALVFSCIAAILGLISIVCCCVLTGILGMAWHRLQ